MAKFTYKIDRSIGFLYIRVNDSKIAFDMDYVNNTMIELLEQENIKQFIKQYEQFVNRQIQFLKRHIENRKRFVKQIENNE